MRLKLSFNTSHPALRQITRLLIPRAFGSAVYQLSLVISTILASLASIVGEGGVAAIYYGSRLFQLPQAIFANAVAQAALPRFSQNASTGDMDSFRRTLLFSLRSVFFILIPASIGLMVLAEPIVRIIFQRGEFTAYSTAITSQALFFASLGLVFYGGIKILVNSFYSLKDTLTPVKVAASALVLNLILDLILMWPLKIGGLALAGSIAASYNFGALLIILKRRIDLYDIRPAVSSAGRTLGAALVMGVVAYMLKPYTTQVFSFLGVILCSIAVFFISAFIFRVEEVKGILRWILPKK